jgi:radical SAM superfamily enzyme YgiQ (UPF0313 family)
MSVLFIQPPDRPWVSPELVRNIPGAFIPRAPFEVGLRVPKDVGFRLLDLNLSIREGLTVEEAIRGEMQAHHPRIVFVSWPTYVVGGLVREIVALVRLQGKEARIVVGGFAVSHIHDLPLDWPEVDVVYNGFGVEIPELVRSLMTGIIPDLPGVYCRNRNASHSAGKQELADGYTSEDFYTSFRRIDFSGYIRRLRAAGVTPIGLIEMGRGCTFNCSFCALTKERIGFHTRSFETVVDEASYLASYGISEIQLIDPTAGLRKSDTESVLEGLARVAAVHRSVRFDLLTRPEFVTDRFALLCKRASVYRVALGMETMDESVLAAEHKTLRVVETERAVGVLSEHGIEVKLFHMMFPGKLSLATVRYLTQLKARRIRFVLQSSFARPLATRESEGNYLDYDHTVYNPSVDGVEPLMEYLLTNLAFPSMDVGVSGDSELAAVLVRTTTLESLKELFEVSEDGMRVMLRMPDKDVEYVHQPDCLHSVAESLRVLVYPKWITRALKWANW